MTDGKEMFDGNILCSFVYSYITVEISRTLRSWCNYLQSALKEGSAKHVIEGLLEHNFESLKSHYDKSYLIHRLYQEASPQQCIRCGYDRHPPGYRCPATNASCFKCNRVGHFGAKCPTPRAQADTNELNIDSAYLDAISTKHQSSWHCNVHLKDKVVPFKLDTGAEVTANTTLQPTTKALHGPARQSLHVLGQITTPITHGKLSTVQTIFVVRGLKSNLPAITALRLLSRVESVDKDLSEVHQQFQGMFEGLGNFGKEYTIKLREGAHPHAIYTPRSVPIPLRQKVKDELQRMENLGVISRVDEPTPWCAGMVVVPKPNGAVRICVDLKPLNESVLQEVHPIPKVDETLAQLAGAAVFSKLDANSGFWQIPLAEESRPLTTFLTPEGRYWFNKLPFGISSAPEVFQKRMKVILEGLEGIVYLIDDILVYGKNQAEHDQRLMAVMKRLKEKHVTLNKEKCKFNQRSVNFVGHLIDQHGIRADPAKTAAILKMMAPSNITELRQFMGMVNQLGKFTPHIAELGQPMRELLSPKNSWMWGPSQQEAFEAVKDELAKPTVLALYDPKALSKVSADASSFGLGAVLLQQQGGQEWRPLAYASRSMSETEKRYAQIERRLWQSHGLAKSSMITSWEVHS